VAPETPTFLAPRQRPGRGAALVTTDYLLEEDVETSPAFAAHFWETWAWRSDRVT
jgi:hypothetical protein